MGGEGPVGQSHGQGAGIAVPVGGWLEAQAVVVGEEEGAGQAEGTAPRGDIGPAAAGCFVLPVALA